MKKIFVAILATLFVVKASAQANEWSRIDAIVQSGIAAKAFPGCQVVVWKNGKPVYEKNFGKYAYDSKQTVNSNTMYDLASLSKTTGTLMAIMKLYDEGKINLDEKVSAYLPFLRHTNKEDITIKELLFHESGLPPSLPFYMLTIDKTSFQKPFYTTVKDKDHQCQVGENTYACTTYKYKQDWVSDKPSDDFSLHVSHHLYVSQSKFHPEAMKLIADAPLKSKKYVYSCVNFILLKEVAETISGVAMDTFLDKTYYTPMKLHHIAYLPLRSHKISEVVPTSEDDFLRGKTLQGFVHDESAAFMGGVSGNAGLFASASDVAAVYQMLLNGGEWNGKRYLSKETCSIFTTTTSATGRRGLGFDKSFPADLSESPCCAAAPAEVYGHTGFTGTCCWVDPTNQLVYVFLSNRVSPNSWNGLLSKMRIRGKIQAAIYEAFEKK